MTLPPTLAMMLNAGLLVGCSAAVTLWNAPLAGDLAAHFDRLLDRLQAQAESLKRWGEALDAEVAKRTAELEQAVADLKAAQSQLVMNEKLAAIGQLTIR